MVESFGSVLLESLMALGLALMLILLSVMEYRVIHLRELIQEERAAAHRHTCRHFPYAHSMRPIDDRR
jgi:hypothetical protein